MTTSLKRVDGVSVHRCPRRIRSSGSLLSRAVDLGVSCISFVVAEKDCGCLCSRGGAPDQLSCHDAPFSSSRQHGRHLYPHRRSHHPFQLRSSPHP